MRTTKMHLGELSIGVSLVRRLLAAQFPQWADLPIERVPSSGTDNAMFRLGKDLSIRMPRIDWAAGSVKKEFRWLPELAPHLPLPIPIPLALGEPGEGYPWLWTICRWLPGSPRSLEGLSDPVGAAQTLADFLLTLQRRSTTGGPSAADEYSRGRPLAVRDADTREAIAKLDGMYDPVRLMEAWETALAAPGWDRAPVWIHGDVLPGNLLFEGNRLTGVIDFSGLSVGDPACDLMIAWNLFTGESRAAFREAMQADEATWKRGRGHALLQAAIFIPYYLNTNPIGVGYARRTLDEILAE